MLVKSKKKKYVVKKKNVYVNLTDSLEKSNRLVVVG